MSKHLVVLVALLGMFFWSRGAHADPGCWRGNVVNGPITTHTVLCFPYPILTPFISGAGSGGPAGNGGAGGSGGALGGGEIQTRNNLSPTAQKHNSKNSDCIYVQDPIDLSSGFKVDSATDFAMLGEMGLSFSRYYVSGNAHGTQAGRGGWTDNLDFELYAECESGYPGTCNTATFMRPDGSKLQFSQSTMAANSASLMGPFTEVGGGDLATLTYQSNGSGVPGTYILVDEDSLSYTFTEVPGQLIGRNGVLSSIKDSSGVGWTITNPSSDVTVVTHTSGQTMTLATTVQSTPNGNQSTLTVTDPAGNNYLYQSDPNTTATWNLIPLRLVNVILPGSTPVTITYHYISTDGTRLGPKALSQVDYNGVPHDTTTYYTNGQVHVVALADGSQASSVEYLTNATGALAKVTNPLGHVTEYQFNGGGLLSTVTGDPSAHCAGTSSPSTYDTNGYLQSVTDNNGYTTHFTYAATGQLQQKIEALGYPEQRTTTYSWDPTPGTDRLSSSEVAGLSRTTYTYNAQNRIASVATTNLSANGIANQTLTTTYLYSLYPNGLVQTMSVTIPSPGDSDTSIYEFDANGNITSVTDGLGHTTKFGNYNPLGLAQHVVGPNGDVTDRTFDARGFLITETVYPNNVAATTTYSYDVFGKVKSVATPDGQLTQWNRDANGVLRTVTHNDNEGQSTTTLQYDLNGDTTSLVLARGGTTALSWTATYDELGRLYTKLGNSGQSLQYAYDPNGNVQSITDANGHVKSYQYDGLNRVKSVTEAGGATVFPPTGSTTPIVPATNSTGAYTVSWSAVTSATKYRLEEQTNGSGSWVTVQDTGAGSWSVTGKANGSYSYRVTAHNSAGDGPTGQSSSVSVVLTPTSAPVLSVPATNNTGAYTLSWNAVSNATSYTLQESVNGSAWSTLPSTGSTSWSTSGRGSATYSYRAQACSSSGCGPMSSIAQTVVTLPPTGVPSLSAPGTNYTGSYTVSWTAVAAATSYELDEQVNGGGWTAVQNIGATSWAAVGRGTATYGYRVRACNAGGCAGFSGTTNTAVTLPPSTAPTISTPGTNSTGQFSISWSAVGGATTYNLIESINGGGWTAIQSGGSTSWTSGSGSPTATYDFEVQACNIAGCGPWSALGRVAETQTLAINGQTYTGSDIIPQGKSGSAIVGFQILTGNTWQVYTSFYNNGTGGHVFGRASGAVPNSAVTVQTTWTFVGYPAGMGDAGGTWNSPATSPVSVSTNPVTTYTTATWPQTSPDRGRIYQLRIDFFNAIGVNISSSTATMIGETTGSP